MISMYVADRDTAEHDRYLLQDMQTATQQGLVIQQQ